jgi:hypothetical protein
MATRKSTTTATGPAAAFYKRLKALGFVFCRECFAYMPLEHTHVASMAQDRHDSRYVLVGGYGNVRAVERDADYAEVA